MSDATPAPVDPAHTSATPPQQVVLHLHAAGTDLSSLRPHEPPREPDRGGVTTAAVLIWVWRSGVLGILGLGFYHLLLMKAQLETVEPRIKAEVAARADDVRKELTADAKKTQEELQLLQDFIELEHVLRDYACRSQFDLMIETYQGNVPFIKKPIPESVRPMIFRLVVQAAVESGKYNVFNEADLDTIDKSLRKDLVFCDSTNLERVSLLYLMDGKIDKARSSASACVAALQSQQGTCRSTICQENATFLYAIFMLIELCENTDDPKKRLDAAWSKLGILQVKYLVQNAQIEALYERQDFQHARRYLSLRRSDGIDGILSGLRDRMRKRDFKLVPTEVHTPNGIVREDKLQEVDVFNPTPEPKMKPKVEPKPKEKGESRDC